MWAYVQEFLPLARGTYAGESERKMHLSVGVFVLLQKFTRGVVN